ncbi:apolipoprotein N-acyltransferase [Rhodoferax koreense]|uniref:Apolipoprotein N-acyltransferase n=1 Tax=Rhodoferax koreensis TaxID=1842727 RepID=A0A1P8K191_9BURK|nr:apolipoprotein N-acyltransferase [Rhodoferax koreense]APW39767.1 apolipoprotein N-acyltransferase [Rhodoferax koreense]
MHFLSRGSDRIRPVALSCALLAGLLQAASMANPFDGRPLWWLQLLSMAGLVGLVESRATPKHAALTGWVFATAWLTGTFWWLFISMHTYGGLAAPLAVAAVVGLAAVLAVYYAVVCGFFRAFAPANPALRAIVFASCWLLAELARGVWFTGFPWGAAGYAHLDGLGVFARYVGVYGIGWIAAVLACLFVDGLRRPLAMRSWGPLLLIGAVAVAAHVFKPAEAPSGGKLPVTLLQGNIPQDEKFEAGTGVAVALQWYGEQLNTAKTPLVVAPETALPLLPQQLPPGYWDALQQRFRSGAQTALIGVPLGNRHDGYTNAVIGLQPGLPSMYSYAKHHLVPFGEFIPPLFKWFTEMMNIPLGDFNRGAVGQASMAVAGQRLAPNICYEDLFGEELGARFRDPAQAPTIFVNVSNIGWFGDSLAIDQHLSISRMRTLEFERPMIRATNTGATAIIDHRGVVVQELPRLTRGVLVAEVEGRGLGGAQGWEITPFAWWVSRFGLWPLWALGVLGLVVGWFTPRRSAAF